jgi:hypothetical protein
MEEKEVSGSARVPNDIRVMKEKAKATARALAAAWPATFNDRADAFPRRLVG